MKGEEFRERERLEERLKQKEGGWKCKKERKKKNH